MRKTRTSEANARKQAAKVQALSETIVDALLLDDSAQVESGLRELLPLLSHGDSGSAVSERNEGKDK